MDREYLLFGALWGYMMVAAGVTWLLGPFALVGSGVLLMLLMLLGVNVKEGDDG